MGVADNYAVAEKLAVVKAALLDNTHEVGQRAT
jgi:hypothetical protein